MTEKAAPRMTLQDAIKNTGVSQNQFARIVHIHKSAIVRLAAHGVWPVRIPRGQIKGRIAEYLASQGIDPCNVIWPGEEDHKPINPMKEGIELMSLDTHVLQHFGLKQNPFSNDVEAEEDVMRFRGYENVEAAIRETIDQRGFLAVIAESGSGKTTIWDGIEAEYAGKGDVQISKPQMKGKDHMTPEHIARALIHDLSGGERVRPNAEDRGRQLSQLLRGARGGAQDRKVVLYIDDAHFVTQSVLRQLKTFFEEKIGRFRLMSIILVGLPMLKNKLSEFPEIGNRVRLVEVPPVPVKEYLDFKLCRVGALTDRVFSEDGLHAFLDRFRNNTRRPPLGRPLVINAMCIRAMVRLVNNGAAAGERITREIVDQIPGEGPGRIAA
ncbi:MAG TPA: AAA family ATPase [Bryobacteraceae bacterium]|nr:AAA family ATPase [Bryobacteraceae bacterium]